MTLYLIHTYATVFPVCIGVVWVVKSRITQECYWIQFIFLSCIFSGRGWGSSGSELILRLKELLVGNHWYRMRENDAMLPGEVMKLTLPRSWTHSLGSWSFARNLLCSHLSEVKTFWPWLSPTSVTDHPGEVRLDHCTPPRSQGKQWGRTQLHRHWRPLALLSISSSGVLGEVVMEQLLSGALLTL